MQCCSHDPCHVFKIGKVACVANVCPSDAVNTPMSDSMATTSGALRNTWGVPVGPEQVGSQSGKHTMVGQPVPTRSLSTPPQG
mmetsp:Transcript_17313/g.29575  ORF Transcript_17313/g.29575 Transcript_17313/m.29575 type:complete len:83 (+) Transcript_17313:368-616(+)